MAEVKGKGRVAEWKLQEVESTKVLLESTPVIGILSLENLPSAQFQQIRKALREKADIRIIKSNFVLRAIDASTNKELQKLKEYINGPIGLVTTEEDPFKLYSFLKKNRSKAAAKPGMVAEEDLIVPAGETDIPLGPALSELKMAKINCRIDKGKIVVASDSTVTKKGEVVTELAASVLAKLGITPVDVGLKLTAVYEKGMIYTPEVLDIDEEAFMASLLNAQSSAMNLAVEIGFPTKQSITFMLQKAIGNARNLAVNANILTKETVEHILGKAAGQMNAVKAALAEKGYV